MRKEPGIERVASGALVGNGPWLDGGNELAHIEPSGNGQPGWPTATADGVGAGGVGAGDVGPGGVVGATVHAASSNDAMLPATDRSRPIWATTCEPYRIDRRLRSIRGIEVRALAYPSPDKGAIGRRS